MSTVLWALDGLLSAVHGGVVLGNLLLWVPCRTRRLHLCLVVVTAASWFGLGLRYGLGYCVLTDWHWMVKRARGIEDLPYSFIYYVLVEGLGVPMTPQAVNRLTVWAFAVCIVATLAVNFPRSRRRSATS